MCDDGKHETISYSAEPAASRVIRPQESHQWFALAVKPRFDKAVARALEVKGYETLLPLYKKHRNGARSKISELPLFPGYVCCRFNVQTRLPILTTPGVIQVLGAGNVPIPLSDVEINSLQTAIKAQIPVQPFPFVCAGQRVRINRGFLAGVEGIVISCKHRLRLVLSITVLQRSVLLEIDRDLVSVDAVADWREGALWASSGATPFDLVQES
jgi:transcription antitermination factor NusG